MYTDDKKLSQLNSMKPYIQVTNNGRAIAFITKWTQVLPLWRQYLRVLFFPLFPFSNAVKYFNIYHHIL